MPDTRIFGNFYLIYSPDENVFYFENRDPDDWVVSNETFSSKNAALIAWNLGSVTFGGSDNE